MQTLRDEVGRRDMEAIVMAVHRERLEDQMNNQRLEDIAAARKKASEDPLVPAFFRGSPEMNVVSPAGLKTLVAEYLYEAYGNADVGTEDFRMHYQVMKNFLSWEEKQRMGNPPSFTVRADPPQTQRGHGTHPLVGVPYWDGTSKDDASHTKP